MYTNQDAAGWLRMCISEETEGSFTPMQQRTAAWHMSASEVEEVLAAEECA